MATIRKKMDPKGTAARDHCSVREAAELAGCSIQTIRQWIMDGRLEAHRPIRIGSSRWRIVTASLRKLLGER